MCGRFCEVRGSVREPLIDAWVVHITGGKMNF